MKVLMINKFYYIKGGSETYLFGLKDILEKNGHEVISFSMDDERNYKTKYEKYFIKNIDYSDKNFFHKVKNATKIIYNFEASKNLKKLIEDTKPEIAHVHIFQHQLSPSILKVLEDANIPIVYTVHDLKAVCLNYKMMNSKGICEKCKGEKYYNCLIQKCVKDSYLFSAINMIEGYTHKFLKSYDKIDKFITPSKFYGEKLIDFGIDRNKVVYIPNFIRCGDYVPNYDNDDYFIFLGRLSEEKGVKTLLQAMKKVKTSTLKIIGTGPIEKDLKEFAKKENISNVEFLGFKRGDELKDLIRKSMFMVIPSEWYENAPMSVLEVMAYGKAVIGAKIGGIPEMVKDYYNGYTFKAFDAEDLSNAINKLVDDKEQIIQYGLNSRRLAESTFNDKEHYEKILSIYKEVLNSKDLELGEDVKGGEKLWMER